MTLRHTIFRAAGRAVAPLDVELSRRSRTTPARRIAFCAQAGIDLALDVGAATGLYGTALRAHGYRGRIISFEPLPDSYAGLRRRIAEDPTWSARQLALGDAATTSTLHVTGNRDSSSLLPMLDRHVEGAPTSVVERTIDVEVARLDELDLVRPADRALLKIDAQGFEQRVLAGAAGVLGAIRLLELELSLVPLYGHAPLYREMIDHVEKLGFEPIWFERGFQDRRTGRLLQIDGIFART